MGVTTYAAFANTVIVRLYGTPTMVNQFLTNPINFLDKTTTCTI